MLLNMQGLYPKAKQAKIPGGHLFHCSSQNTVKVGIKDEGVKI